MLYSRHNAALVLGAFMLAPVYGQSLEEQDSEWLEASFQSEQSSQTLDSSAAAELLIKQTNEFRREEGLKAVEENAKLKSAALYFAEYMARTDKYGHLADGARPSDRASRFEYDYCLISENIAYHYSSTGFTAEQLAQRLVDGWKQSPDHRKNLLDADVQEAGVALARSPRTGFWYAVQMFGRPKSAAIEFKISNHSNGDVSYNIGGQMFQLPPRYTRTHTRCRTEKIVFGLPTKDGEKPTIEPRSGSRHLIERQNGRLAVRSE
jgi:uncharacterized protein YkwD